MSRDKIQMPIAQEAPTTMIRISKKQAGEVSIGDNISVNVSGEVVGLRKCYEHDDMYDMEVKNSKVSGIETNDADREYKKMVGK